jgi:hypothetical protein
LIEPEFTAEYRHLVLELGQNDKVITVGKDVASILKGG